MFFSVIGIVPVAIGIGSFLISRFIRSLRYSIAGTPDGVRVGFGLLSTSNETLPPGRIHSVQVSQSLLWRGLNWWQIKVNRASRSSTSGAAGQENTTILPVGSVDDVSRVLELLLPDVERRELIMSGLTSKGGDDGYTNSPKRAAVLRWFSWRRNGFAVVPGAVLLRKGAVWRETVIVPQPRVQSVALRQGPVLRRLRLAAVQLHTVAGPIRPSLGAIDKPTAVQLFTDVADAAVASAARDTSHRWRAGEATA